MTAVKPQDVINNKKESNLFDDYYWFYSDFYKKIQKCTDEFFKKVFQVRFMGISGENNILFYGDEYFVNKIPVNKISSVLIRVSSNLVSSMLDNSLGTSENLFELKNLTDIEAGIIKSFTYYIYKNIEESFDLTEVNKKVIQSSENYNFTFYLRNSDTHGGKIILTVPEYLLPDIKPVKYDKKFDITDFKDAQAGIKISAGSAKITLNEIKTLEDGDIIVLENSDINRMGVIWDNNEVKFRITPNPSLIISIDNNGGNDMEEETSKNAQNMWDSILVDVIAEFDNVKLTLGELKQISEGLVIDIGSVYDNKIKLRVENQVVASGELVIINDRYGVRIDNIKKSKDNSVKTASEKDIKKPAKKSAAQMPKPMAKSQVKQAEINAEQNEDITEENENFDYSDFEIEDESI